MLNKDIKTVNISGEINETYNNALKTLYRLKEILTWVNDSQEQAVKSYPNYRQFLDINNFQVFEDIHNYITQLTQLWDDTAVFFAVVSKAKQISLIVNPIKSNKIIVKNNVNIYKQNKYNLKTINKVIKDFAKYLKVLGKNWKDEQFVEFQRRAEKIIAVVIDPFKIFDKFCKEGVK